MDCETVEEVRSTLRTSDPDFGHIPLHSDESAMRKFETKSLAEAHAFFMPYLQATWEVVRCPDDRDQDDFALELFRGEDEAPTLALMRENPEEQLGVIKQRYARLWHKLLELHTVMGHAASKAPHPRLHSGGLVHALDRDSIEQPHERTGELQRVARPPDPMQNEAGQWFNRIIEHVRGYSERLEMLTHMLWRERQDAMTTRQQREEFVMIFRPSSVPTDDFQHLLLYVGMEAHRAGYARHGENCFREKMIHRTVESGKHDRDGEPILTQEMYRTCAWVQVCEIRDFIYQVCSRRYSELMWSKLHSSGSGRFMSRLLEYFCVADDQNFPQLDRQKMRSVYSFSDGVYVARDDTFFPYGSVPMGTASCKYIDGNLLSDGTTTVPPRRLEGENELHRMNWTRIPTPHLQKILDAQELDEEVCAWLFVFLGRMLYATNDKDRWQIMLFIKGVAGSGKSTLGMLVKMFYDPSDVGVLSNNVQKQFALADLYEKLVVICFEVKHNFRLDQAELQSLVSGEEMAIFRKHKEALTIKWKVPALFMGNEVGPWINASNSITRRMALLKFDHKPTDSDPDLLDKLREELPRILLKVNQAYLAAIDLYGRRDIWDVMPEYFRQTQTAMKESTNPFVSYLNCCSDLVWSDEFMVPLDTISKHFRNFCRQGGWPTETSKWTEELYKQAFAEHVPPIRIEKVAECQVEGRTMRDVTVAVGFKIDDSFM